MLHSTEICVPECLNGGSCRLGRCVCPSQYDGIQCESGELNKFYWTVWLFIYSNISPALIAAVCDPPCRNGDCVNGECICTTGWEGDQCEQGMYANHAEMIQCYRQLNINDSVLQTAYAVLYND